MHRFILPVLSALVMGASAWAQDVPTLGADLPGLLQWARTHNPELLSMHAEAQAAGARAAGAGALPDPRLRVELMDLAKGGDQGPTLLPWKVGSTRYTLMQEFPAAGKRALRGAIAEQESQAQVQRARASWQELRARLRTVQAQRWFALASQTQLDGTLALLERMEQLALQRYAQGLAPQAEVLRAQTERSTMQRERLMRVAELRQGDQRLNALLGRDVQAPLLAAQPLAKVVAWTQADLAQLQQRALAVSAQVAGAVTRVHAAELSRDLARKNRSPDFTVGLSPTQMQNSVREWAVMVEFNLPWRDVRQSEEREALAMLEAARQRQESEEQQLRITIANAVTMLERARDTAALNERTLLPQVQWALQAALNGYEQGKVELTMVLELQRQLRQTQQDVLQAQLDAQLAQAELDAWLGDES